MRLIDSSLRSEWQQGWLSAVGQSITNSPHQQFCLYISTQ